MAQFSLHAYDADVWVPEFRGLNQADVGLNPDLRYAAEVNNMETPDGILQPRAGIRRIKGRLDDPITMITPFHRRRYTGSGTKEWFVCFSGGQFWYRQGEEDIEWTAIPNPAGVTYAGDEWSVVAYEKTENNETVDVLLVSNKEDGMYMIIPPDRPTNWGDEAEYDWDWMKNYIWQEIKSPSWAIRTVATRGAKFGVIERYADRIWGGDIADDPDKLMYSAVYLPDEWRAYKPDADPDDPDWAIGEPENGAGDILQPSWDGDRFIALKRFGDQLIAIKENHIWRVVGTNPGVFEFREQYGAGSVFKNSIVIYNERMFMATKEGLSVYDGMTVTPYKRRELEQIWPRLAESSLKKCNATLFDDRMYISFYNNRDSRLLIADFSRDTLLYYRGGVLEGTFTHGFMQSNDKLYAIEPYIAVPRGIMPGPSYAPVQKQGCGICEIYYDSWKTKSVYPGTSRWVSQWIDFGYKRIQKGGFDLYFIPEVQDHAVTLKFSIQTEKKLKTKTYMIQPLTKEQRAKPKEHRGKRLHFGGMGRKFRIIIETELSEEPYPWRLIGGLQLVVETDPD